MSDCCTVCTALMGGGGGTVASSRTVLPVSNWDSGYRSSFTPYTSVFVSTHDPTG